MHNGYRALRTVLFVWALVAFSAIALAADYDTPRVGGGGGGLVTRVKCAPGSYLTGFAGRTGAVIDAIAPICAPWLPDRQALGRPVVGRFMGGTGGAQVSLTCPGDSAVSGWEIRPSRDGANVEYVAPECRTMLPPRDVVRVGRLQFGTRAPPPGGLLGGKFGEAESWHGCPEGQLAVGMLLRARQYLERAGLVCGPAPVKPKPIKPLGKHRPGA